MKEDPTDKPEHTEHGHILGFKIINPSYDRSSQYVWTKMNKKRKATTSTVQHNYNVEKF